jgi:Mn-dependent DtxR family transcriptional regulator
MATMYELSMDRSDIDESEFTETELGILDMLSQGRCTPAYIADELDVSQEYVRDRLRDLKRLGLVEQVHRGLYELSPSDEEG